VGIQEDGRGAVQVLPGGLPAGEGKAGLSGVKFHSLRHTFASHLVMAGVDLVTVKELLGHKSIKMTMKYSHLSQEHKRKAIEILDGHYMVTDAISEKKAIP